MLIFKFFVVLLFPMKIKSDKASSVGVLDHLINATLEAIRPNLANVYIKHEKFETGPQEIGMLEGNFREVTVQGLDKFKIKIINTTFIDINNLTIVEENFVARGLYRINGTLAFPLGKKDVQFYGDGEFGAEMTNLSTSMKVKIRYENGQKVVKEFDLTVRLEKLKVFLKNLMGGGELEGVFNKLFNDVGLTVFNYYKDTILELVKPKIRQFITEMLNSN